MSLNNLTKFAISRFLMASLLFLIASLLLIWAEGDANGQSIREKANEIDALYDKLIQEADGVSTKQILAANIRQKKYSQLISETQKSAIDFDNMEDLLLLARAAEHAKMEKETEFYSRKIISADPASSEAYVVLLRLRFNQGDIAGAEKLLVEALSKAREPDKLDGYIGILAFAMSQAERHELAITYFEKYLNARADSISRSSQLFEILGAAIEQMALNCSLLKSTDRFNEFVASYIDRLEKSYSQEGIKIWQINLRVSVCLECKVFHRFHVLEVVQQ